MLYYSAYLHVGCVVGKAGADGQHASTGSTHLYACRRDGCAAARQSFNDRQLTHTQSPIEQTRARGFRVLAGPV